MALIAVISDVHGNLPALEAVLKKINEYKPDIYLCLGDVVGYGPYPSECVDLIKNRGMSTVLGNHDAGVCGKLSLKHFKSPNRRLIEMTSEILNTKQMQWLRSLPLVLENQEWLAVHAEPINPEKWMYVDSAIKARKILAKVEQQLCFVGHTHMPGTVSDKIGITTFNQKYKYLINPGSVGQSRDADFRASYCMVNTDKWSVVFDRVAYDTERVLTKLSKLGFTRSESHRLLRY